jgi:hypothetical protein
MILSKKIRKIGDFFKGSVNIIKFAAWLFSIQIMISLFSVVFGAEENSELLKLLSVLMLVSVLLLIFYISKSTAVSDFEILKNNNIRRKIKDNVPSYKAMLEYRSFKGFLAGFLSCFLSIVLTLISIMNNSGGTDICGVIARAINLVYIMPLLKFGLSNSLYYIFGANAVQIITAGMTYLFEGEKLKMQYKVLQKEK